MNCTLRFYNICETQWLRDFVANRTRNKMHYKNHWTYFLLLLLTGVSCQKSEHMINASSAGISVSVNPEKGDYIIHAGNSRWTFKGTVGQPLSDVTTSSGRDSIGSYKMIRFNWKSDHAYRAAIRRYDEKPVLLFLLTTPNKTDHIKTTFPSFTIFPDSMHHFSYGNDAFAPPKFSLTNTSTPWLFFNDRGQAFILSPASDFIVSKMIGDGQHNIASGLNQKLKDLPARFTHKTILVLSNHIHAAWACWGEALRSMYGTRRPGNESDPILKYYGYWTDNGADYYYTYDKSKGYGGTLQAVKKRYQKEGIPIGYMQLDSWWYEKSKYGPDSPRNAKYMENDHRSFSEKGDWDNPGGMLIYQADKDIFPHGLKYFYQQVQVPLVVHNRWIDPRSPYHKKYNITGYAATDPAFWNHIAGHIKSVGVTDYEQDWLNVIYNHTPEMAVNLLVGNAFTDNMARAMESRGIDMQYCMAMPRFFMQGVKYNNLITIRTSNDRFGPTKWRHFLYTSQLAYSMGIWPWCDVFKSHEAGNMIVSVLSGGVVGTGDALGKEDMANIRKAARTDGVLVKPDAALLPLDSDYIHAASHAHKPMLAYTYTRQNNVRTNYVFAYVPPHSSDEISFTPSNFDLRMKGAVVIYDPLTGSMQKMNADSTFTDTLSDASTISGNSSYHYTYYILAPITPVGIGFFGDKGKITATGRQRIPILKSTFEQLTVQVAFAKGESSVYLHGYYEKPFTTNHGTLNLNPDQHTFVLNVSAPENSGHVTIHFTSK